MDQAQFLVEHQIDYTLRLLSEPCFNPFIKIIINSIVSELIKKSLMGDTVKSFGEI